MIKTTFSAIALLFTTILFSQTPVLKVPDINDNSVSLKTLKIDVKILGNISTTTMEMTFFNSNSRILEGNLTFPLPEGVSVSGYALDINGRLRDAVPVEKEKATQVFESIERRNVDPGLLEKVDGNNFRTRIYPLPAGGYRTVRISYDEILKLTADQTLRYSLPLSYTQSIADFKLNVQVIQSTLKPKIEEQPGDIVFNEWNNNYSASLEKKNFIPAGSLRFAIPKSADAAETVMQKKGDDYYFLINTIIDQPARKRQLPQTVGIIWDASISGLQRNIPAELELLDKYINENKNILIQLATFNNTFEKKELYKIVNGEWSALRNALETITYDGATNFSTINLPAIPCEEYLLFSDGMSTFAEHTFVSGNKPVYAICSSPVSDYGTLFNIANNSGAQLINLNVLNTNSAVKLLLEQPFKFIGIQSNSNAKNTFPSYPVALTTGTGFSLTGISAVPDQVITLQFGYGNTVTVEKKVQLNFSKQEVKQVNLQRFWAQQQIAELDLQYEKNKEAIASLGRMFSIVTRNTSLMVLETAEDYVRYKIEPPAEFRKEYYAILKQRQRDKVQEQEYATTFNILEAYQNLYKWWNAKKNTSPGKLPSSSPSEAPETNQVKYTPPMVVRDEEVKEDEAVAEKSTFGTSAGNQTADAMSGKISGVVVTSSNQNNREPVPVMLLNEWVRSGLTSLS